MLNTTCSGGEERESERARERGGLNDPRMGGRGLQESERCRTQHPASPALGQKRSAARVPQCEGLPKAHRRLALPEIRFQLVEAVNLAAVTARPSST